MTSIITANCNDPGNPDDGVKEGADYLSEANVTFRCNPPFELEGSPIIICKNGEWSDHRPTCFGEYSFSVFSFYCFAPFTSRYNRYITIY